jgi:hypothetical protein
MSPVHIGRDVVQLVAEVALDRPEIYVLVAGGGEPAVEALDHRPCAEPDVHIRTVRGLQSDDRQLPGAVRVLDHRTEPVVVCSWLTNVPASRSTGRPGAQA